MISFQQLRGKAWIYRKTWIWVALGLIALPALRIYYVQEMLAALIGFSLLFAGIFVAVLAVFVLARGSKPALMWSRRKVGRAIQRSVETAEDVVVRPEWAKAVPVWAKAVPNHFRRQQVRLNENYKMVYSRFARLGVRPVRLYAGFYRASLQKGGAALTIGLRTPRRLSNQLGNWLRQPVRYPDFIRLPRISRVRLSVRTRQPRRRR